MAAWAPTTKVDRTTDRWQRIRQACGTHAAKGIDLDQHADHVTAAVENATNTTGTGRAPTKRRTADARKDTA